MKSGASTELFKIMSTSNTRRLTPFSGVRMTFPQHRLSILNFASSLANGIDNNGLLGFLLSLLEFTSLLCDQQAVTATTRVTAQATAILINLGTATTGTTPTFVGVTGHFTLLANPGRRPVSTINATSTTQEIAIQKELVATWDYDISSFTKQHEAIQLLKDEMIKSLDPNTLAELSDPKYGTQRLTPASILAHLDTKFGTATSADLMANHALMAVTFQPSEDFLEFVQVHRNAHLYAERSGQLISSADKVASLKQAITPCGLFEKRMYLYFATNSTVASQTFLAFSDTMVEEWTSNILPSRQSLTVATFSAAAVSIPLTLAEEVVLAVNAAIKKLGRATPTKATVAGGRKPTELIYYCWTHGTHCGHTSLQCTNRKVGHKELATESIKLGGNEEQFVPWNFKLGRRAPSTA